jgi:hypothetical protein
MIKPETILVMDAFCHTLSRVGHSLHAVDGFSRFFRQNGEALALQSRG